MFTHDERAVITTDDIVRDEGGSRVVEGDTYAFTLAILYLTGELFKIVNRTVEDSALPNAVDAGEDVDVGTEIPSDVITVPQSANLDLLDIIGLLFHSLLF